MKANEETLDLIFNYYTQYELAHKVLAISQWELLEKMKDNSFTQEEIDKINNLFEKEIRESKEYIHDVFMGKIKLPQDILDSSFESAKEKILKWIPDRKLTYK